MPPRKTKKPTKDATILKSHASEDRLNIDINVAEWRDNFQAFARQNPAALVVGAIAVLMAILLVLN